MSQARQIFRYPGSFEMRLGGSLPELEIAYETWGRLNERRDNAVLLFTGMSPSAHATSSAADPSPGWWEQMVGPGRPIDTRRFFVVCMNSLGSCFGSTGPASPDPRTGAPYRLTFPVLTLEDVANAGRALVAELGISRGLLLISTAARSLPFATALRSLQREMIRRDPAWNEGNYAPGAGPVAGMRLARKLGMITYRSALEWEQRFGRERTAAERRSSDPFGIDFEVEAYLEHHALKFTGDFDANCYLYLSRASDLFDVADHGGSLAAGLGRIRVERAMVIGVETDLLFPIRQQRELAAGLESPGRDVRLVELPSIQGHDSFLVDMDRFRPVVAEFFAEIRGESMRLVSFPGGG